MSERPPLQADSVKALHETSLKWFEIHAAQRMTSIHFYFTFISLDIAAYGSMFSSGNKFFLSCLAILLICFSAIFKSLDRRTESLVKKSESALRVSIEYYRQESGLPGLKNIVDTSDDKDGNRSYREIFNLVFYFVSGLGLVGAIVPWSR